MRNTIFPVLTALVFISVFSLTVSAQTDSIRIVVNDSTVFWHKIKIQGSDTVYGTVKAVYLSDTGRVAWVKNYYNGYLNGLYKSFYPDGKIMERIVYQKGKRNGEYTLYSYSGEVLIKGIYKEGIKNGFWIYKNIRIQGKYKNGQKHGKWKWRYREDGYYQYIFENGKMVKSTGDLPPFFPKD